MCTFPLGRGYRTHLDCWLLYLFLLVSILGCPPPTFFGTMFVSMFELSGYWGVRPSKQPLMVRTFLKVYMELGSYFLFLQEQIKDIIIICGKEEFSRLCTVVGVRGHVKRTDHADIPPAARFPPYR
jgi:hypothetical protein